MTRFLLALAVVALLATDAWACGLLARFRERRSRPASHIMAVTMPPPTWRPMPTSYAQPRPATASPVSVVPALAGGCTNGECPLPRR